MNIERRFVTDFITYIEHNLFDLSHPADPALKRDLQGVIHLSEEHIIQRPSMQMPWLIYSVDRICGGDAEFSLPLCLAVFLFSRLITIVDDMQDNDEMRCGEPAYWVANGRLNTELASLSLLSLAYLKINTMRDHFPENVVDACVVVFSDMFLKTTEGQRRDLALSRNLGCTMDDYLDMVELKGGVIHACLVALGVLCARKDAAMVGEVYRAGIPLGMALQFYNDMKELQPFRERHGRDRNSDFFEGRISLPFIYGRNTLPPLKRKRLLELYQKHDKNVDDQGEVDALLGESGITVYTEMLADSYIEKAVEGYRNAGLAQKEIDGILELMGIRRGQ
jgi:geranylgeranyl pyrophosphate synthase